MFPWIALFGAAAGLLAIWRSQQQAIGSFEWSVSWAPLAAAAAA